MNYICELHIHLCSTGIVFLLKFMGKYDDDDNIQGTGPKQIKNSMQTRELKLNPYLFMTSYFLL